MGLESPLIFLDADLEGDGMAVVGDEKPLGQSGDKTSGPGELVPPGDAEESVQLSLGKPPPRPAGRAGNGQCFLDRGQREEENEETGLQEE